MEILNVKRFWPVYPWIQINYTYHPRKLDLVKFLITKDEERKTFQDITNIKLNNMYLQTHSYKGCKGKDLNLNWLNMSKKTPEINNPKPANQKRNKK